MEIRPLGPYDLQNAGPYHLLAVLGEGMTGRVLLGRAPDGRLVAVEQIHPHIAQDPQFRSRFGYEVAAWRRVTGGYTAAVLDADPFGPVPWLASEFVPGPSLHDVVARTGPLPEPALRLLLAGLASALLEIHRAGLVHRDLKPGKVLLVEDGPRVIDACLARAVGGAESTATRSMPGSPAYLSPEQAENLDLTPASDVFSVGALIAMAATGASPFAADSGPQTMFKVVHSEPDLSGVPEPLRSIVDRCLAKDPAQRPDAADLLAATSAVPGDRPGWPRPVWDVLAQRHGQVQSVFVVPPAPPQRPRRRGTVVAAAVAAVLLLVVAATVGILVVRQQDSAGDAAPVASAEHPVVGIDGLRTLDTCALLDEESLALLGQGYEKDLDTDGSCFVSQPFDLDSPPDAALPPSLSLTAGWYADEEFEPTGPTINGMRTSRDAKSTSYSRSCSVLAETTPGNGISIYFGSAPADPCSVVDKITPRILDRLAADPVAVPTAAGSVQTVDPCALLTEQSITAAVGKPQGDSTAPGVHTCLRRGAKTGLQVTLGISQRPDTAEYYPDGPLPLPASPEYASWAAGKAKGIPFGVAGATGYEVPAGKEAPFEFTSFEAQCMVLYMHRPLASGAEVAAVAVEEGAGLDHATACLRARALLGTIIPGLPES